MWLCALTHVHTCICFSLWLCRNAYAHQRASPLLIFMAITCLPLHDFCCFLKNLSKPPHLPYLLKCFSWHVISPRYKGNLSKLELKGKEREGGPGFGVVREIPVSSENITCPRVLVTTAGVLTHQDPPASCLSLLYSSPLPIIYRTPALMGTNKQTASQRVRIHKCANTLSNTLM